MLQREIKANGWSTAQPLRPLAVRAIFLCDAAENLDVVGDFKDAIAKLKAALALDSRYARAYRDLARALWRSGDAAGTAQAESDMIPVAPADADWELLARALSVSDPANAAKRIATLRAQFPVATPDKVISSAPEVAQLGLNFFQGKKDSISDFETLVSSLETPSAKASARREMAWWMYRAGDLSQAQQQLDAARQIYPQSAQTVLQLAWVLSDLQRQADASQLLDSSGVMSGFGERDAETHAVRALIEWRTEQRVSARGDFEIAAREDPVWMGVAWVRNNFSSSAANVIAQLESAEAKRRLKVASQRTPRGN
jgi:tetratricopeptide (TPR) repeat protein